MANDDTDDAARTAALDDELSGALGRGEFFVLYQPTMDLVTDAFVGVEVLLRWRSPSRGVVEPGTFLARLESSGAIVDVGDWVLRTACERGAAWHSKGHRFLVSVNVAGAQLADVALPGRLESALDDSGFDARHLVLEFPGELLASAHEALAALKDLGVRLCVDDFGADPQLANRLDPSLVEIVKIDRSLVRGLSSADGADRLRELVELGRRLQVQTIAQGIEDDDQRLQLRGEHVAGQGFLLSVPHTDEELDRLLEDYAIFSGRPL